ISYWKEQVERAEKQKNLNKIKSDEINKILKQVEDFKLQYRYEEALKCYDRALEIDPTFVNLYYGKGIIFVTLGRYDEALKCYDRALEIDPEYPYAWNGKGNVLYN